MTSRTRAGFKLLLLVALLAGGWFLVRAISLTALIATLRHAWWAGPAFVGIYTVAAALNFSGLALTLLGGVVFGFWWGAFFNTLGANLGATAAFWLARRLGRDGLQPFFGDRLAGLDRLTQQSGFAWLLRLRLIPVVPFNLLNLASGLTALPWRTYAAATALGILPGTLVYTFFADAILAGSRDATRGAYVRVLIAGGLLVLLSFAPTLARRAGWTVALPKPPNRP